MPEQTTLYSDETTTGALRHNLRGLRQITIGARCLPDSNGFDWIRKFKHDFLPPRQEPKSISVIHACMLNPRAKDLIRRNICESTIFVIDIFQDVYAISRILVDIAPDPRNVLQSIVTKGVIPELQLREWLLNERKLAMLKTAIPKVKHLLAEIGLKNKYGDPIDLLEETRLSELNNQQFSELVTRFSVAFADVCSPKKRAEAVRTMFSGRTLCSTSFFAATTLKAAIDGDLIFDIGDPNIVQMLQDANGVVKDSIEATFMDGLKPQREITQADSQHVLGIQAADIAAGCARWWFEEAYAGDTLHASYVLREEFRDVVLNDHWLSQG